MGELYLFYHYIIICYQYIINMAEAHYYILNIAWACKLNHKKDSRHVSPITDSQTVQAQICTDMLGYETNSKLRKCCACSFSEVFCVKGLYLLHFHHANEVFQSS